MSNNYEEEIKMLIKKGYSLELISEEFDIPRERLVKYKNQINQANKRQKVDPTRKKIEDMISKYNMLFKTEDNKTEQTSKQDELNEEEIDQLAKKIEGLIDKLNKKDSNQLKIAIRTYIRRLEEAIRQKAERTNDIEELEKLSRKITPKICKESLMGSSGTKTLIQTKISKIKQEKFIRQLKENVPKEIKQVVKELADGTLDVDKANETINNEAKRRVKKSPKGSFALTEERHRNQILMQINTALKEKGEKYPIKDLKAATEKLVQLENLDQLQVAEITAKNAISRKKFATAKAICSIFASRVREDESKHIDSLRKQVKLAELGEMAKSMLTNCKTYKQQEEYYNLLEATMKAEGISPNQIPIGKNDSGNTIYLGKIWNDEKQR